MLRDVAILAQSAERIHGKDEVNSSILLDGSKKTPLGVFVCQPRKQTALLSCRRKPPPHKERWYIVS